MEKITAFFKKNWIHFAIIALFFIITVSYFNLQFDGYGLKQHDIEQYRAMSKEISDYREKTGEETLWTNSMFGGMPSVQISLRYEGNYLKKFQDFFIESFPPPAGIVLLYMIGFYIFALCLGINPWIGLFGAVAFAFSTYDIIIIQAGHNSKAYAVAYMAPVIGSFIMAYKRNLKWGILLSALFMTFEITQNHLQVTYYLAFLILALGIVFFIDAILKKEFKTFALATGGIIGAYLLAIIINYGNITLTNDYAKHTIRGGNDLTQNPDGSSNKSIATSGGLDKDYITQWSYGIGESFTLLSPYVKGGGSVPLQDSPFAEDATNLDLSSSQINAAMRNYVYWGEQPITSGPVYIGIIVAFLAFLGMFYIKSKMKWALLAVTILTLALSWGKNYMGLTDFFLDNVPGYNKFRAVTIILVMVELCLPILAVLFLNQLVKEREVIKEQKKKFLAVSGSFVLFLLLVKMVGLKDNYTSEQELKQQEGITVNIKNQLASMDPSVLLAQYKLDINNPVQVEEFVNQQAVPYKEGFEAIKTVRASIFDSSMNRSILFTLLAFGVLALLLYTQINTTLILVLLTIFVAFDLIPVAKNYLGNQEGENGYKYWDLAAKTLYPLSASEADYQILDIETATNPKLKSFVNQGIALGEKKANELALSGNERIRVVDAYKFGALNENTNYRVFDMSGGFSSANSSYFHKSLGGYHGAKLRNIQNVFEFHLAKSNNKVYDILNVKYFIQQSEKGAMANPNLNALGNVWFVKNLDIKQNADEEIKGLGNQFEVKNSGMGALLVNKEIKKEAFVYGSEELEYVVENDTLPVRLSNGMEEGMEAVFVMDIQGKTNLVPKITLEMDTAKSFLKLVDIKVTNEFKPKEEALILSAEAKGLKHKKYSASGKIEMTSYAPNKISYAANSDEDQFAVFSEIYYPEGWTATIDGKEVEIKKVNYLLRGLEIPKGKHKIEFSFMMPKYEKSALYARLGSGIILLLLAGLFYFDFLKKKKD